MEGNQQSHQQISKGQNNQYQFLLKSNKNVEVVIFKNVFLLKIMSMDLVLGRVQLKMLNCLLSLCGMSFLPPPGCIIAAKNIQSTMVEKSPGLSKL